MQNFIKMRPEFEKILKTIENEEAISLNEMKYLFKSPKIQSPLGKLWDSLKKPKRFNYNDNGDLMRAFGYLAKNKYIINSDYLTHGIKEYFSNNMKVSITTKGKEYLSELEDELDARAIAERANKQSKIANFIAFTALAISILALFYTSSKQ